MKKASRNHSDTDQGEPKKKRLNFPNIPLPLKIAFSIILLVLVAKRIDIAETLHTFETLPLWLIVLWLSSSLMLIFVNTFRWLAIIPLPLKKKNLLSLASANYLSSFYSLFLPSSLGGDVVKWGLVLNLGASKTRLGSTIFLDRVLGVIAVAFLALGSFKYETLVKGADFSPELAYPIQLLGFGALVGLFVWLLLVRFSTHLGKHLEKLPMIRDSKTVETLISIPPKIKLACILLSALNQMCGAAIIYLVYSFAGVGLNYPEVLIIVTLTALVGVIPISFGGYGTSEFSVVFIAESLGAHMPALLAVVALSVPMKLTSQLLNGLIGFFIRYNLNKDAKKTN